MSKFVQILFVGIVIIGSMVGLSYMMGDTSILDYFNQNKKEVIVKINKKSSGTESVEELNRLGAIENEKIRKANAHRKMVAEKYAEPNYKNSNGTESVEELNRLGAIENEKIRKANAQRKAIEDAEAKWKAEHPDEVEKTSVLSPKEQNKLDKAREKNIKLEKERVASELDKEKKSKID